VKVLLVEDERTLAVPLADALEAAGHEVVVVADGAGALARLAEERPDLVLTDVRLPGASGIEVLKRARSLDPPCPVLVMTGYASVDQAVEAMRGGAVGYLQKPFPMEALLAQVERVAEEARLRAELRRLRMDAAGAERVFDGRSPAIREVEERLLDAAPSEAPVLLLGESGTGKERAARALHDLGPRAAEPFVAVGCGGVPEALFEGEFFGHLRGAFTGADEDRSGLCAVVGAGTLFLDDVQDLPVSAQAKLLRLLQEREFVPLGAREALPFRARVVASAAPDLEERLSDGRFRPDLYHRLRVLELKLPPLRHRIEDLADLLAAFLRRHDPEGRYRVGDKALAALRRHPWPGNVRELENAVARALALADPGVRVLKPEHFFPAGGDGADEVVPLHEAVRTAEIRAIRAALAATGGRKAKAAGLLGVSRKVLWQKMRDLGIDREG